MSTFDCTTFTPSLIGADFLMSAPYFLWESGEVVCLDNVFRDLATGVLMVSPGLYVPDRITPSYSVKMGSICRVSHPDRSVPLDYFLRSGSPISRRDD